MRKMPYLHSSFLQKSPIISCSFAGNDLQLKAFYGASPPCTVYCVIYEVATISRLLKMIGLFCRILSLLWVSFAKETYHFKAPTNRSHPIYNNWVIGLIV